VCVCVFVWNTQRLLICTNKSFFQQQIKVVVAFSIRRKFNLIIRREKLENKNYFDTIFHVSVWSKH